MNQWLLLLTSSYIHCDIPDDEHLAKLVCKVQKHRHSVTCRRHGHCRFHYPRPPSPVTVVARECNHSVEAENLINVPSELFWMTKTPLVVFPLLTCLGRLESLWIHMSKHSRSAPRVAVL